VFNPIINEVAFDVWPWFFILIGLALHWVRDCQKRHQTLIIFKKWTYFFKIFI